MGSDRCAHREQLRREGARMCCREVLAREHALAIPATVPCKHLEVNAEPQAPARVRAFIRESIADEDGDFVYDVAMVTSELVTNAVIHARTPIEVGILRHEEQVLVSVGDRNLARPEQQPYSDKRTSGRGLRIVRGLTDSWGVTTYPSGKSVWFIVRRRGTQDEDG